ncbi:ATPase [uncultured Psychrobacter sp.]|uniref:ATPase n=1 Tax=uncultured Psychrobacter sp. TaxID=259303 RepID=UPI00260B9717|nr:ATPase [uncultured Psychrobacter sp.]
MSNDKEHKTGANKKNDDTQQAVSARLDPKVVSSRLTPNPLSEFSMDKDELRLALVTAQFALRATRQQTPPPTNNPTGLLVLVNGMEQAGKGSSVKQLRQWVDPRLLKVEATIGYPPLAYQPIWQAHTKAMPRHGDVMVYFGNWYADLIHNVMRMIQEASADRASRKQELPTADWHLYLTEQLAELQTFEQDLCANHTKVLKCWFHIDAETLKERLNDDTADPQYLYQIDWCDEQVLEQFNLIAATILREQGDWVIIDGNDKSQAQISFCHEVLHAIQAALASSEVPVEENSDNVSASNIAASTFVAAEVPKALTDIKDHDLDKSDYKEELAEKQAEFAKLIRARGGRHVVFAFEGMDAAGKGGSIKRMVAPLDPREYQIYNIGAPMLYELQHPYLWRFWTRLPNEQTDRISRIAIFDRTWYGRVLVERVEALAGPADWQRAYGEINRFEADLQAAGTLVIKYWLAIDKDEQLKRFEARRETPHKKFKLTDDDWRNREKWSDYVQAAADMLAHTDTEHAPWCIVATNDKRRARLDVLDHAIAQLKAYK